MAYRPRYTITTRVAAALARCDEAQASLNALHVPAGALAALRRQAFVCEAYHTTRIEGARLSLDHAQRLLAGESSAGAGDDDARELLNYREALALVEQAVGSGASVTQHLLREIHERLMRGVRGDAAGPGAYRTVQIHMVHTATGANVYTPPPPRKMRRQMADLVAWLADPGELHPVLVAGLAHLELVRIHPFLDGNGRSARLLTLLCLYRSGYDRERLLSISEYYNRDRSSYYHGVRIGNQEGADVTGWLAYFAAGLAAQLRKAVAQAASR